MSREAILLALVSLPSPGNVSAKIGQELVREQHHTRPQAGSLMSPLVKFTLHSRPDGPSIVKRHHFGTACHNVHKHIAIF